MLQAGAPKTDRFARQGKLRQPSVAPHCRNTSVENLSWKPKDSLTAKRTAHVKRQHHTASLASNPPPFPPSSQIHHAASHKFTPAHRRAQHGSSTALGSPPTQAQPPHTPFSGQRHPSPIARPAAHLGRSAPLPLTLTLLPNSTRDTYLRYSSAPSTASNGARSNTYCKRVRGRRERR